MFRALKEFRFGRPQIFAALLLLAFLIQCLWVASSRRISDLEYEYIASGYRVPGEQVRQTSPFTGLMAALPLRIMSAFRNMASPSAKPAFAIPRRWVMRLPFVIFGLWLGGALWWVARRLFCDRGGYVALGLFCFSPAIVMISSNMGPEVILAWGIFGLIYTAMGVAHTTVYAPRRKWPPRILLLGTAIGICISTAMWSCTIVLLAFAFMLYLSPGRRRAALLVFVAACLFGLGIFWGVNRLAGVPGIGFSGWINPHFTVQLLSDMGFFFAEAYWYARVPVTTVGFQILIMVLMFSAMSVYGAWPRSRYFGNSAPLITAYAVVLFFGLQPGLHLWEASLGLSFTFLFVGGVAADLLETRWRRAISRALIALLALKAVLDLSLLYGWIHQNGI